MKALNSTMQKTVLLLLFVSLPPLVFALPDPADLLSRIDRGRDSMELAMGVDMVAWDGDRIRERQSIRVFTRTQGGQNNTLVWFDAPSDVAGRRMLMQGPAVYLLFPRTRNPVRLSPLQVLMGESSNGDIARTAFSLDYAAQAILEAERGGMPVYQLDLVLRPGRQGASYPRVRLFVDTETLRPLEAHFQDLQGKVLKSVTYRNYKTLGEGEMAHELDIWDQENPSRHTVLTYSTITPLSLPAGAWRREYLGSWVAPELAP